MTRAIFFVTDESGNQISDEHFGETNEFGSFSAAERAARNFSKKNPSNIYSVDVAINQVSIKNGRIIKEK